MKRYLFLSAALFLPLGLMAQEDTSQTDRDRSMIVGFLEDNLSGAGRDIRIEGFKGLLSSTATLDELTIADSDGVWFTLRDAELDWSRSALFSGRVEVNRIAAGEIIFERLPVAADTGVDLPDPEATPFSLPDLPVSIDIGEIAAERVLLGAPVIRIGEDIEISLVGSANLADGSGGLDLEIERIDGSEGAFDLAVSYANATEQLDLDLSLREGPGGLVSTIANLPGAPSLSLTAQGSGPLDDFVADITLATQDEDRLSGQISLAAEVDPEAPDAPAPRRFTADLSGDLTPLFSAEYAPFFGASSTLVANGVSYPAGGFDLDRFSLSMRTVSLVGSAQIAADGLPSAFSISGSLKDPDDRAVLLPFGDARSQVDEADIIAQFNAGESDDWAADITVVGYQHDGLAFDSATLGAGGKIARNASDDGGRLLSAVSAAFDLVVDGFASEDQALQDAIGSAPALKGRLTWREGRRLIINGLTLETDATTAQLDGRLSGVKRGLEFTGRMSLDTPRLERFAGLSGMALSGGVSATAEGSVSALNGTFDLTVQANGDDLAFGIPQLDALTGGNSTVAMTARRDTSGLTLEAASLDTAAVTASASGNLSSDSGALQLNAELDDVARLGIGLSGPLTLETQLDRASGASTWQTNANMSGPGGSTATLSGSLAQDFATADLSLTGNAPLGLANSFTTAVLAQGSAGFDIALNGPLALSSVAGQVNLQSGARVVVSSANLALTLQRGNIVISGEQTNLDILATADTGGQIQASGSLGLTGALPANLSIALTDLTLVDPRLYTTSLGGEITIDGPLAGGASVAGDITLGTTEVTVSPSALGGGGALPDIIHIGASSDVIRTQRRSGLLDNGAGSGGGSVYGLDLVIRAPGRIFVRGRGLDAELGGRLRVTGTTADVIPVGQFSLIRGRLSLLGQRIDLEEGAITLQGELDPTLRLVAQTATDDMTIQIVLSGPVSAPELTLSSSPEMPQDEILAQLLFGKDLTEISALQAAQMASAVATLTGNGGGLVGSIRDRFGLDDLDLQTTEDGDAALKVGKYISDKVYTDVTIDSEGKTEINLNLDATRNITIKGSVTSEGDTGVGVFFERDY
ncbi:translocation/assembly module TamB domain-containing protein [Celeribacter litoreus]|uniref:translocation/assembly module TamB domain-containing protein n=1 Tax=Celeribacter litoreus TaxID=2876714 RepID=UPI001CCAD5B5|nr:translocation/assembly module TamB domain-containing protein [Celeribacter litoreus]MCA0042610.1 translocation/assembly module TamB domain-containing protein [Celeribacter litoreus]